MMRRPERAPPLGSHRPGRTAPTRCGTSFQHLTLRVERPGALEGKSSPYRHVDLTSALAGTPGGPTSLEAPTTVHLWVTIAIAPTPGSCSRPAAAAERGGTGAHAT